MLIKFKCVTSVLLVLVFAMGLVQEFAVTQADDTPMAVDFEQHDNPGDSEPDIDEDGSDLDLFVMETRLPGNSFKGGRYDRVENASCGFQALKTSQPTPPPELIG